MSVRDEIFAELESKEFIATVNLASDLQSFLAFAEVQKPVLRLMDQLNDPGMGEFLLQAIVSYENHAFYPDYENPYDTPIAVLLWLLHKVDLRLAQFAAGKVFGFANCWWARKIASDVLSAQNVRSHGTVSGVEIKESYPEIRWDSLSVRIDEKYASIHFSGRGLDIYAGSVDPTATMVGYGLEECDVRDESASVVSSAVTSSFDLKRAA